MILSICSPISSWQLFVLLAPSNCFILTDSPLSIQLIFPVFSFAFTASASVTNSDSESQCSWTPLLVLMLLFFPDSWSLLFTIISPHTLHSFDYNNRKFFLIYVWWVSLKKISDELFAVCLMCYSLLSFKFSNPLSNGYCFSSGCMLLILKLAFVSLGDFYFEIIITVGL